MKTDLLLIPMSARWADMRAAALAAEDSGFDGLWTWDHLRDRENDGGLGVPEAWTVLTALAGVTRRVSLGPLVLNVANRPPGVLANMAATLQTVCGGRLLLGLGAGGNRRTPYAVEQAAIGQSVERDAARDEHTASGRDASRFVVTVFAGLDDRMLRADSRARQSLERAGVQRLILLVSPPFDAGEIKQAGRLLSAQPGAGSA